MTEENQDQAPKSGKLKTMIVLGAVLLIEAAAIIGAMKMFGPDTSNAEQTPEMAGVPEEEKIVEIQVLDARLPNSRSGIEFIYDTEIYVQVRKKHEEQVNGELEQFKNEIRAQVSTVWRTSDPHHFKEPRLENLTRKVSALMDSRFDVDPESGEPIVVKCVIVMGTGLRVDS